MKKSLKTLLITGLLAGMCAVTPVYGADYVQNGATRVIRVGVDAPGAASVYDQQTAISSGSTTGPNGETGIGNSASSAAPGGPVAGDSVASGQTGSPATGDVFHAEPNVAAEEQAIAAQAAAEQAAAAQQAAQAAQTSSGRHIDPSKPMIALTFDDGPYAKVGNRIMDVMNQYGGKCTFFMVGNRVASYKTEVNRMVNEGFEVANHTQDHKYLNKLGAAAIQAQVSKCNDSIQAVCGVRPTLMRLPGGNKNSTVLANTGMPMIQWNVDTLDWKTKNTQSTINAVVGKVKDGDIVLMHELYPATAAAVEQIVPALVNKGFQLVTVSELAHYKGKTLSAGHTYAEIR